MKKYSTYLKIALLFFVLVLPYKIYADSTWSFSDNNTPPETYTFNDQASCTSSYNNNVANPQYFFIGPAPTSNIYYYTSSSACQSAYTTIAGSQTGFVPCTKDVYSACVSSGGGTAGTVTLTPTVDNSGTIQNSNCTDTTNGDYCLLEPLTVGSNGQQFSEVTPTTTAAQYLNTIFEIILGIIGVLTVVMLVVGGVEYMSTDAIAGKEYGRETVTHALLGLFIGLGAYVLLYTINPTILNLSFFQTLNPTCKTGVTNKQTGNSSWATDVNGIPEDGVTDTADKLPNGGTNPDGTTFLENPCTQTSGQTLASDTATLAQTEQTVSQAGAAYTLKGTYALPQGSPGVNNFATQLSSGGYTLQNIVVSAVSPWTGSGTNQNSATFYASNGSNQISVVVPVNIGYKGISNPNGTPTPVSGDNRTPYGTTLLTWQKISTSASQAIYDSTGQYNMGAAFIDTGATYNGGDRGIGFHGSPNNVLGTTNGCIRMYNDDLLLLGKYMKAGISLTIN